MGTYGVSEEQRGSTISAPELPYRPLVPANPQIPIALVGCGGIARVHLEAYRNAGFNVVALCSRSLERAEALRSEFFPGAAVARSLEEILSRDDVAIVDIMTDPDVRLPLIEAALLAGKHVLSQKPYALDLEEGRRLAELAETRGLKLAVNQNGRWAPHWAWMREAISAGLIGQVASADFQVHWDHHWIVGTNFENVEQLVLSDFAIHWFDIVSAFFEQTAARRVSAASQRASHQRARPPFLAHAMVEFDAGQATLAFNAACAFGQKDRTSVLGSLGTLRSVGPSLQEQTVTLHTAAGSASPVLQGHWFPDGFQGAMAELICAIEQGREPLNSAMKNLRSLSLCSAAVESARSGRVVEME